MSDADERSRFASREYVARVARELGLDRLPEAHEREARATYEAGYLRGCTDTLLAAAATQQKIIEQTREIVEEVSFLKERYEQELLALSAAASASASGASGDDDLPAKGTMARVYVDAAGSPKEPSK